MTDKTAATTKRTTSTARLTAAGEIDAWCTKCRMDLTHRIVALVAGTPKRVLCLTCSSEHNYRAPKGVTTPQKVAARNAPAPTKKAVAAANALASWEARVRSGGVFKRYSISETFEEGDLIDHKKFGQGFVVAGASAGKVTVVFADGERTLVQGVQ